MVLGVPVFKQISSFANVTFVVSKSVILFYQYDFVPVSLEDKMTARLYLTYEMKTKQNSTVSLPFRQGGAQ